jgi:hypothetical protein
MELAEGPYDDRRLHGGYFDHNVQLCAHFQWCIWNDGLDGFKEPVLVVLRQLVELEKLDVVSLARREGSLCSF